MKKRSPDGLASASARFGLFGGFSLSALCGRGRGEHPLIWPRSG
jgi:hypothetical protein